VYSLGHVIFSGAMLALAVATVAHAYSIGAIHSGAQYATAGFFAVLMAAYLWQGFSQFLDRNPVLVVGPEGLSLPAAMAQPIPWRNISRADCFPRLLQKGRLEIQVDPDIFAKMRFGRRLFGDNVVARSALHGSFMIYAQGYDHKALEIFTALRTFWSPGTHADET